MLVSGIRGPTLPWWVYVGYIVITVSIAVSLSMVSSDTYGKLNGWQPIETAPKNMRQVPGGGRPIEIFAEWAETSCEWSIAEWDDERGLWVHHDTDEPLAYANDDGWARKKVWWRALGPPPPLNPTRWMCTLQCGHEVWVTSKRKPKAKLLACEWCKDIANGKVSLI